ncbi:DUF488 domain-containing protein [Pannus brasiliensis CCIBt3594]|uniref:DUF488 domain-containing protein n=1 Tax=Pannus brasiliensis CCIBt3594 TaxID=1427578 RepID=A0AAW9QYP8_9CHRO
MIRLFTIGFTKKSAEEFFEGLQKAGVRKIIDTRLHNTSQLSGFAKQADLQYFLGKIGEIDYRHETALAPTGEMLTAYKKKEISWEEYADRYLHLIGERKIESILDGESLQDACFLCSEDKPHHCHRRLAAEYLQSRRNDLEIIHL